MRKVTREAIAAFNAGRAGTFGSNTTVSLSPLKTRWVLKLHGNAIARRGIENGKLEVRDGGWQSNTTKERLNGLQGVSVNQKNFIWYLNGEEWDGSWTAI